jgi:hypothetical protein
MNVFCAWIKHLHSGKFRGQERLGPLKISFEMALKVISQQKNNLLRYINSYYNILSCSAIDIVDGPGGHLDYVNLHFFRIQLKGQL